MPNQVHHLGIRKLCPDGRREILRDQELYIKKFQIILNTNNTTGYREKWLHSLLIEKMQDGRLPGLVIEFLYYETPVGKVRRNKQFGREHIDKLKLILLAPDTKFKNAELDMTVLEQVKRINCEVVAAYIDLPILKHISKPIY